MNVNEYVTACLDALEDHKPAPIAYAPGKEYDLGWHQGQKAAFEKILDFLEDHDDSQKLELIHEYFKVIRTVWTCRLFDHQDPSDFIDIGRQSMALQLCDVIDMFFQEDEDE